MLIFTSPIPHPPPMTFCNSQTLVNSYSTCSTPKWDQVWLDHGKRWADIGSWCLADVGPISGVQIQVECHKYRSKVQMMA
jgi:hypothetical protein